MLVTQPLTDDVFAQQQPQAPVQPQPQAPVGEVAPTTGTEVEQPQTFPLDPDWKYERIEYRGDHLAVRKASLQALTMYQLSSGKYISMERQNNASGLFIDNHFGPDSYDRITERMMDPDDPDYDMQSFGEIVGQLVKLSIADIKKQNEALAAAKNGQARQG